MLAPLPYRPCWTVHILYQVPALKQGPEVPEGLVGPWGALVHSRVPVAGEGSRKRLQEEQDG